MENSMELELGADETTAKITICRDMPGDHIGGPDCFCCPTSFDADDEIGIDLYLRIGQYETA